MTNWIVTVELSDIWAEDLPFTYKRNLIVQRILDSGWLEVSFWPDELGDLISDLGQTQSNSEFDSVFSLIYDYADNDAVWIATF